MRLEKALSIQSYTGCTAEQAVASADSVIQLEMEFEEWKKSI